MRSWYCNRHPNNLAAAITYFLEEKTRKAFRLQDWARSNMIPRQKDSLPFAAAPTWMAS